MKLSTLEEFINSMPEELIWKLIEDYESWKETGVDNTSLLRSTASEFCSIMGAPRMLHTDYMSKIAMGAYRYFALKYNESMK